MGFGSLVVATLLFLSFISIRAVHAISKPTPTMTTKSEATSNPSEDADESVFEAIQLEYKHMASWYDTFWHSYTFETLKIPISKVKQAGECNVVDVGSGTGELLRRLKELCEEDVEVDVSADRLWIGVEPSKEMLDIAAKKFDPKDSSVELRQGPAEHLPVTESSADIVVSTNAFHFFRNKEKALQEMQRILKKDGTLVITDWCNDYWIVKLYHLLERIRWNWRFKDPYPGPLSKSELLDLVGNAGFREVESVRYRVRVFVVFFWGMQTITAKKGTK